MKIIMKILKWSLSCLRILMLKIRWGKRLKLKFNSGKPIYIGRGCIFSIDKDAQVELGAGVYLTGDIEINAIGGANIVIGQKVYIGRYCCLVARKGIKIGEYSLLAPNVAIYDHNHKYRENIPISRQGYSIEPVVIGANSWLCKNAFVAKGVQFNYRIILGANSVLNKQDLCGEENGDLQVYVGNPAKRVESVNENELEKTLDQGR